MNSRERLTQVSRGGTADRKPVIQLVAGPALGNGVDALSFDPKGEWPGETSAARLALIPSLSSRALATQPDLLDILHDEPEKGDALLNAWVTEIKAEIESALEKGADGFVYALDRAYPAAMSPMQYGGHFLELDREILTSFEGVPLSVLWVQGTDEPYIDFVSDLPAHFFAWEAASGVTPSQVAEMRAGALASTHAESHALIIDSESNMTETLFAQEAR